MPAVGRGAAGWHGVATRFRVCGGGSFQGVFLSISFSRRRDCRRQRLERCARAGSPLPRAVRNHAPARRAGWIFATALLLCGAAPAQTIDLYVDEETGQVYVTPGENRTRLGTFQRVDTAADDVPADPPPVADIPPVAPPPVVVDAPAVATPAVVEAPAAAAPAEVVTTADPEHGDPEIFAAVGKVLRGKWYERLTLRGYTQFRYHALIDKHGDGEWFAPADKSVSEDTTFLIRRGRLILSGDATDWLYVYVQPDMNASPSDGDFSLQLRDLYADIALDRNKEFRVRVGQSKVPFGFVNLQSSQNRIPLERPDSINSAAEGERDIGVYLMWAPQEQRDRFRDLVRQGLKGSGDYGVVAVGVYSGQGLNRLDSNDDFHYLARFSYPIVIGGHQIVEPGLQGYWGRFVPRLQAIPTDDGSVTPTAARSGVTDRRVGMSFVVYPQPIGVEAEWNVGEGPTLRSDYSDITPMFLHGGYVQASYKVDFDYGDFLPVMRWQYYDGGRKFARNAPHARVSEFDFGFEWAPVPEVELATMYTYTPFRTDSSRPPYEEFKSASRIGLQVQWNY